MEETTKPQPKRPDRRVLLTTLAVLIIMAMVCCMTIYQLQRAEAHARYMGIRNVSAERVAKIIRGAEMNANNIFDDVSNHISSPEGVIAALKSKANLNLDVRGYFAAFEPNYFPEKGTWFEPYIYQPTYGGFEFRQVGSARHNYTKSPWYIRARESNGSFWSDPYYYYDGTPLTGFYCTFVKPIFNEHGNLACVCGADMKLDWLTKELEWVDENSRNNKELNKFLPLTDLNFYTIILGKDGTCISHPDEKKLTITDKEVLKNLTQRKGGTIDMDIDGQACTVYYGPIEYIDWSTAVIVPKQDFLKPMLPVILVLLGAIALGMTIMWFVCKR